MTHRLGPYVWVLGLCLVAIGAVLGAVYGMVGEKGAPHRMPEPLPTALEISERSLAGPDHPVVFLYIWELNAAGLTALPVMPPAEPAAFFDPGPRTMHIMDPDVPLSRRVEALVFTEVTVLEHLLYSRLSAVTSLPWQDEIPDLSLPGYRLDTNSPTGGPANLVDNATRRVRGPFALMAIQADGTATLSFRGEERTLAPGDRWLVTADGSGPASRWGVWHMGIWNLSRVTLEAPGGTGALP